MLFWSSLHLKLKVEYPKQTVWSLGTNYLYLDITSYGILNLIILTTLLNIYWQRGTVFLNFLSEDLETQQAIIYDLHLNMNSFKILAL